MKEKTKKIIKIIISIIKFFIFVIMLTDGVLLIYSGTKSIFIGNLNNSWYVLVGIILLIIGIKNLEWR